jgi:hypothetical protein
MQKPLVHLFIHTDITERKIPKDRVAGSRQMSIRNWNCSPVRIQFPTKDSTIKNISTFLSPLFNMHLLNIFQSEKNICILCEFKYKLSLRYFHWHWYLSQAWWHTTVTQCPETEGSGVWEQSGLLSKTLSQTKINKRG